MCGIFGYVGDVPARYEAEVASFLSRLAVRTAERGRHATGICFLDETEDFPVVEFAKAPVSAERFVRTSAWKRATSPRLPRAFVGHTRYSTGSDPGDNRNNHPFVGNRYAVVHNGAVRNANEIENDYEIRRNSETDSEVILGLLELCGPPEVGVREVFRVARGNIAVAAIDRGEARVILFRNDRKPLVAVHVPRWRSLVFASTADILARSLVDSPTSRSRNDRLLHYRAEVKGRNPTPSYVVPSGTPDFLRDAAERIVSLSEFSLYTFDPDVVSLAESYSKPRALAS